MAANASANASPNVLSSDIAERRILVVYDQAARTPCMVAHEP
jgi:hypothetical protein